MLMGVLTLSIGCTDPESTPALSPVQSFPQYPPAAADLFETTPDSTVTTTTPGGDVHSIQYHNGKRHGYTFLHHPDSSVLKACWMYAQDTLLWTAYAENLYRNLLPIKGLTTERDCVEVVIPFVDGSEMYRGWIMGDHCAPEQQVMNTCAMGVHRMFYPSGVLRAEIDYSAEHIRVFSEAGDVLADTPLAKFQPERCFAPARP